MQFNFDSAHCSLWMTHQQCVTTGLVLTAGDLMMFCCIVHSLDLGPHHLPEEVNSKCLCLCRAGSGLHYQQDILPEKMGNLSIRTAFQALY